MTLIPLQLNKYETDIYFLQRLQSNTTDCLIIHVFCKSSEHEIVFVLICTLEEQFHVRKSYKTRESTLLCIGNFEENIDLSHIHLAVHFRKLKLCMINNSDKSKVFC